MHRGIRRALLAGAAACGLAAAAPHTAAAASCSWMDTSQSAAQRSGELVAAMSLDDKINLVTGSIGFGSGTINPGSAATVAGNPALCLPSLVMNDAGAGIGDLQTGTTAFPDSIGQTATWDRAAQQQFGEALGQEAFTKGVNVLLAPGMDVTRTPLNGRTFEYAGEDPYLAGKSAAATIRGVQSEHVVATAKHYALNSQEVNRNTNSEDADEQTEQEIYLAPFETAVREGGAGAAMCAYNQVHGVYSCENPDLLNTILKGQFGFTGWVMSDWFGTHSTAAAANAGLDQEMPGGQFFGPALKTAVQNGDVPMARLDDMVHRIAFTMFRLGLFDHVPAEGADAANAVATTPAHLAAARATADEGAVLLKNAGNVLPLAAHGKTIAVIGPAADDAGAQNAYQGAGSGRVPLIGTKPDVVSPLSAITARAGADGGSVVFDKGTDPQAAAAVAKNADVAVVVVHNISTEGVDLPDLRLHSGSCDVFTGCKYDGTDENALIQAVADANPHTVVVLNTSSAVTMPWLDNVSAVLETWYPGQQYGTALASLLFGDTNPSGKLPRHLPRLRPAGTLGRRHAAIPGRRHQRRSTAKASTSATAGTTPSTPRPCSRSATGCPTPASRSRTDGHDRASTARPTCRSTSPTPARVPAPTSPRSTSAPARPFPASNKPSARCAASTASRSTPARPSTRRSPSTPAPSSTGTATGQTGPPTTGSGRSGSATPPPTCRSRDHCPARAHLPDRRRRRHRAGHPVAQAGRARVIRGVRARRRQDVHGVHDGRSAEHRGRRDAERLRSRPPDQRERSRCRTRCRSRCRSRAGTPPVSHDPVTIGFSQHIGAGDAAAHRHLQPHPHVHALDNHALRRLIRQTVPGGG